MRQAAVDVSAHSAVKEEWIEEFKDLSKMKKDVREVAKKNFPEKERNRLVGYLMSALNRGHRELVIELKEIEKMSQENKEKYLVKVMQRLRELPVAASAIKFCSNLFREANSQAFQSMLDEENVDEIEYRMEDHIANSKAGHEAQRFEVLAQFMKQEAKLATQKESKKAAKICHKVLTGELARGPEWAEKAAESSQPNGQHLELGRLQKVNATEKAWKVSLDNVCKDECIELVKEMRKETEQILGDVAATEEPPSYEETCAKRVVQKVEAEILGCCAEKCGWNGRACMLWPFLSREEKGQWEAQCCTEFNILKGSSRATMCDATLTGKENKEVIRDGQPNTEEDRAMIGQDPDSKGTSFLQGENTPIPRYEGTCPDALKLGILHAKLKDEWTTIPLPSAEKNFKHGGCGGTRPRPEIGNCAAFMPKGVDGPYVCFGSCLVSVDGLVFTDLTDTVPPSVKQLLYVHKSRLR